MGNHEIKTEVDRFRAHQRDVESLREERARNEQIRAGIERDIAAREGERDRAGDDFIRSNKQFLIDKLRAELPDAASRVAAAEERLKQLLAKVQEEGFGVVLGDRVLSPHEVMAEANAAALDLQHPVDRALLAGQLTLEGFGALFRDPITNALANDYLLDLQRRGRFEDLRGEISMNFANGGEIFDAWLVGSIRRSYKLIENEMPSSSDLDARIEAIALAIPDPQPRPLYFEGNELLRLVADRLSSYVLEVIATDPRRTTPLRLSQGLEWSAAARSPTAIDQVWWAAEAYLELVLRLEQRGRLESRLADPLDDAVIVDLHHVLADLADPGELRGRRKRAVQLLALMRTGEIGLRAGPARR